VITLLQSNFAGIVTVRSEIKLYQGAAPGSEHWNWREKKNDNNRYKVMTVYNVVSPSLIVYTPDPSKANGTGIVVCPGGGFHFLAIDHEGTNPAKELVAKGNTVFVLKYRTVKINTDTPFEDMLNVKDMKAWDDEASPVVPLAIQDGREAITCVRRNSKAFGLDANRIGIMGFSAGGLIAAATAFAYSEHNRPDFVAPVYADIPESVLGEVKHDAPALFLACTQDDEFGFAQHAIRIYNKWDAAGRSVEMHLFAKGGHGFGVGNPENTTGSWMKIFHEWLNQIIQ
jgi:acetyl esterase/lipase